MSQFSLYVHGSGLFAAVLILPALVFWYLARDRETVDPVAEQGAEEQQRDAGS